MYGKTTPLYLLHPAPVEHQAKIVSYRDLGDGRFAFVADMTVFFPASGGQPSDIGTVSSKDGSASALIERAAIVGGAVEHLASPICGSFAEESDIIMSVNRDRRSLHTRLHSAGELVCSAVRKLGHDWYVSSANHYPGQSRIVYDTVLTEEQRWLLLDDLTAEIDRMLLRNNRIRIEEITDRAEAARLVGFVPDYVPAGEPVRIVFVSDGPGRPCCGTHVTEISEVGSILIRKIRTKKAQTSISYDIAP